MCFIGKACLGGDQEGKGTHEDCAALWLAVSGFIVMELVSGLPLANQFDSGPSWWHTHGSAKMDASEKDSGRWYNMWQLFDLSQNSSSWRWLVSSMFLTRTSCCKIPHKNGYYGIWPW